MDFADQSELGDAQLAAMGYSVRKYKYANPTYINTKDDPANYNQLGNMEFNLGNYTSEDMTSLTMITTEMNRRMEMTRGMKRGRKV